MRTSPLSTTCKMTRFPYNMAMPISGPPSAANTSTSRGCVSHNTVARYRSSTTILPSPSVTRRLPANGSWNVCTMARGRVKNPLNSVSITTSTSCGWLGHIKGNQTHHGFALGRDPACDHGCGAAPSHHRRGGTLPRSRCVAHRVLLQAAWPAPVSWPRDHRRRVRRRRFRYQSPQTAPCARVQRGRVSDAHNWLRRAGPPLRGYTGGKASQVTPSPQCCLTERLGSVALDPACHVGETGGASPLRGQGHRRGQRQTHGEGNVPAQRGRVSQPNVISIRGARS